MQSFYEKRLIRKRRNLKKRPQKEEEETEKNRQPTLKGAVFSGVGDTNRGEDGRDLEEFGVGEGKRSNLELGLLETIVLLRTAHEIDSPCQS